MDNHLEEKKPAVAQSRAEGANSNEGLAVCDCCKRQVERVRSSIWHGDHRICQECFIEWYDPSDPNTTYKNATSPERIGNFIRAKHGMPLLTANKE